MLLHFISLNHEVISLYSMKPLYIFASVLHHLLEASDQTCVIITLELPPSLSVDCGGSDCTTGLRFQKACGLLKAEKTAVTPPPPSSEKTARVSVTPVITGHVFS